MQFNDPGWRKASVTTPIILWDRDNGTAADREMAFLTAQKVAEQRLRCQPYLALRHVACDLRDGVLILRGLVPSYHLKQIAQTVVTDLAGILRIENQIEVICPSKRS